MLVKSTINIILFNNHKDIINSLTDKQFKEEGIYGKSSKQYEVLTYQQVFLLVNIIYDEVNRIGTSWEDIEEKYNLTEKRRCLACKGISLDSILLSVGLPPSLLETQNNGIEGSEIQTSFTVEPVTFEIPEIDVTNTEDINELLSEGKVCKNLITLEITELLDINTEDSNSNIYLEL